ncbi:MAG TPA: decaprenyl-phosphate phosphoribosyltransferase [Actinopolymorphaceae bacterium]
MTTAATERTSSPPQRATRLRGLLGACRPKQWLKNVLVLAAPAAAGVLDQPDSLLATAIAFLAFCLAASGTYLVNDARDAAADRLHPRKRHRPVAAGTISPTLAYVAGGCCLVGGLAVSMLTGRWQLTAIVLAYVILTTAYSLHLKRVPILDLISVAGGFVLRAAAGAVAVAVPMSSWFLIVATLGSLFMVAGKREAELANGERGESRATLRLYSKEFLWYVRATSSGALLVSYCLWAFEHEGLARLAFGISIVPFAVGILRYAMLVDTGFGEEPEEVVLSDSMLLLSGLALVACIAVGVYVV